MTRAALGTDESTPVAAPTSVLVVDDEPDARELIRRWLAKLNVSVIEADDAEQALDEMRRGPVAVAFCDVKMPGHDGFWLAGEIQRRFADTAVVMATGVHDVEAATSSLRCGAIDYLIKPFGRERLREALSRGLSEHRTRVSRARARRQRQDEINRRSLGVALALSAAPLESRAALEASLSRVMSDVPSAWAHARRVADLADGLGRRCGLSPEELAELFAAALTHDIGQLVVAGGETLPPEDIGRLGQTLLTAVPTLARCAPLVSARWERFDGQGPGRVAAADIAVAARILAVADAFDTTLSDACAASRAAPPPSIPSVDDTSIATSEVQRALAFVRSGSGRAFDPVVVDLLIQMLA
ncbi:MAG: response regulator [Vicinamibacterales bacterium]